MLPLVLAGLGIIVSIVSTFFVRTSEDGNPQTALNMGIFGSVIVMIPVAWVAISDDTAGLTMSPCCACWAPWCSAWSAAW